MEYYPTRSIITWHIYMDPRNRPPQWDIYASPMECLGIVEAIYLQELTLNFMVFNLMSFFFIVTYMASICFPCLQLPSPGSVLVRHPRHAMQCKIRIQLLKPSQFLVNRATPCLRTAVFRTDSYWLKWFPRVPPPNSIAPPRRSARPQTARELGCLFIRVRKRR